MVRKPKFSWKFCFCKCILLKFLFKLVELKNGETYNGHLVSCDTWMNINLREVICTSKDGDKFWRMNECYIRGSTIKYLRIPDEVIDLVKDDVQAKTRRADMNKGNRNQNQGGNRGGGNQQNNRNFGGGNKNRQNPNQNRPQQQNRNNNKQ